MDCPSAWLPERRDPAQALALKRSGTRVLGDRPLPQPTSAKAGPADSSLQFEFKEWVRQHEQYPHCWGVVYANHDPHRCMAEADAKRAAADRAQNAQLAKPNGEKFDWSSEWTVRADGLRVWTARTVAMTTRTEKRTALHFTRRSAGVSLRNEGQPAPV